MRHQGHAIVRGVLSRDQIEALRAEVGAYFRANGTTRYGGKIQLRGMHVLPAVARLMASDKIVQVLRAYTAGENPILTGECDFTMNTMADWHKDLVEDMHLEAAVDDESFSVYKLAIYLQDQPADSKEVLKVRPGSHLARNGRDLGDVPLAVQAGDILIFDVRIDHAGRIPSVPEKLLRRGIRLTAKDADSSLTRVRSALRRVSGNADRIGIFATFGPDNDWTYAYERAGRHRHGPLPAALAEDARAAFDQHRIRMLQPA